MNEQSVRTNKYQFVVGVWSKQHESALLHCLHDFGGQADTRKLPKQIGGQLVLSIEQLQEGVPRA